MNVILTKKAESFKVVYVYVYVQAVADLSLTRNFRYLEPEYCMRRFHVVYKGSCMQCADAHAYSNRYMYTNTV